MSKEIEYPELTKELRSGRLINLLKFFGPGAIIASVTIGSGETIFASRGGALFGYALLWSFLFGALMKGVQVYTSMRHITLTGEHPMERWAHFPGPRAWFPILIALLSIPFLPFWIGGLSKMLGSLTNWITWTNWGIGMPLPAGNEAGVSGMTESHESIARTWGTVFMLTGIALTLLQSYKMLEKAQTVIVALLIGCVLVSAFAVKPDLLAALKGMFVPVIPPYDDWVLQKYPKIAQRSTWVEVMVYVGTIGGGTTAYIGYIGMLREKDWGALGVARKPEGTATESDSALAQQDARDMAALAPISQDEENIKRGLAWLRAPLTDAVISFVCVVIFTMAFMILGAVILRPQQLVPAKSQLLNYQAQFLTNLHPLLLYLYQLGVFLAFFGSIYGLFELYVRTTHECLKPILGKYYRFSMRQVRLGVLAYCGIGGVILMWMVQDPISIVKPAAIFAGVFTCGLWCFAMIWTDRKFLPKPYRMGSLLFILTWISGIVLTAFGVRAIYAYFAPLLH